MEKQVEKQQMTFGRYYLQGFANGIKKFTQSTPMVAIVNAFISAMPIIIAASIFTLIGALPEMFAKLSNPDFKADWLTVLQDWTGVISNWSMGILGVFVTAALARNMIIALNQKLPLARRVNEQTVFFAAITVYLMLSVITFTVDDSWSQLVNHTGRAIFVDGMAAQGILPGLIVGLTMPYFFYWGYKYNWTIRLPKQVPQTISQAFLAIVPLLVVYLVYGSIAFWLQRYLQEPVLFWLFDQIKFALTNNQQINDSYGLFTIYSFMESGFWFLGVHPEPVHAVMRAAFWFENINQNAHLAPDAFGHLFTEPYAYGFAAMGGSGTTLMVPLLCLLFCRSTKLRITGKTAVLPIVFQVNEPALFGVPLILNPIFAIPFLLTGWINNMIFLTIWKLFPFQAGSLYLPWSAPFFLVTTLGTPTSWQPYLMVFIALFIASVMYIPFLIIQDKIYMKEELAKLGSEAINFKPVTWMDIIQRKAFGIDPVAKRSYRQWKKSFGLAYKEFAKQQKVELNKFIESKPTKEALNKFIAKQKQALLKLKKKLENQKHKEAKAKFIKRYTDILANAIEFEKTLKNNRVKLAKEKRERMVGIYQDSLKSKQDKILKPLNKLEAKLGIYQDKKADMETIKLESKPKSWSWLHANNLINRFEKKIKSLSIKIEKVKALKPSLKLKKDPQVIYNTKVLQAEFKAQIAIAHAINSFQTKYKKYLKFSNEYKQYAKAYSDAAKIQAEFDKKFKSLETKNQNLITSDKASLANGTIPWSYSFETTSNKKVTKTSNKISKLPSKKTKAIATGFDKNKKYNVIVICLGAGSSAVLANTIHDGLRAKGITNVESNAYAWGSHEAALDDVDLVLLSPQMGIHAKGMQSLSEAKGFKLHCFRGREYIEMTKDKLAAADFVIKELGKK